MGKLSTLVHRNFCLISTSLVLVLGTGTSVFAQMGSPIAPPTRAMKSFLRCARKVIQSRRGGLASVKTVAGWLDNAREASKLFPADFELEVRELAKDCWKLKKDTEELSEETRNIGEYLGEAETFDHSPATLQVLRAFYSPLKTCKRHGADVEATIGLGGTAGIVVGICRSLDGRVYYLFQPRVGLALGLTVAGGVTHDESNALVQFDVATFKHSGNFSTSRKTLVEDENEGYGIAHSAGFRVRYEVPLNFRTDWKSVSDRLLQ